MRSQVSREFECATKAMIKKRWNSINWDTAFFMGLFHLAVVSWPDEEVGPQKSIPDERLECTRRMTRT
jgi:hypothetical protein